MTDNSQIKPHGDSYNGRLFIVSAPSGAGKSTLCQAAIKRFPDLVYSVSATTRRPRAGETDGVDYFFISRAEFEHRIQQGDWVEWAAVYGYYYGTSAEFLTKQLQAGRRVLLDIDVAGTKQILQRFPDSVTIFIMPLALDVLRQRLEKRGAEDTETMENRLAAAKKEMAERDLYQYIIVNDQLDDAIEAFCDIIARHQPQS